VAFGNLSTSLRGKIATDASDGSNAITMQNNTAISPTAASDQIYFEANVFKVNQNGTESTVCNTGSVCTGYQATLTNPIVAGTMGSTGQFCTKNAASNTIDCNTAAPGISDTVYGAGWNGDTTTAPSKNAVYDKIESIAGGTMTYPSGTGIAVVTSGTTWGTTITPGTGVATALAVNTGSAGAFGVMVVKGTSALGTGAIASGACATVVTTAATGAATTDVINWGFGTRISQVTGYAASVNGNLQIQVYPTADNVNIEVCNLTASSITPSAVTLNWNIIR
jgi:hypothetical protein